MRYARGVRLVVALGLVLAGTAAFADPVDPTHLAPLATGTGKGEPTAVYATGVDPDVVMFALGTTDFAVLAGGTPVDGKLGDRETVSATAAFDAIAPVATLRLTRTHGHHPIDRSKSCGFSPTPPVRATCSHRNTRSPRSRCARSRSIR